MEERFVFPEDLKKRAGAIRITEDGKSFFTPVVVFGPDGKTPLSVGGGQSVYSDEYFTGSANTTKVFSKQAVGFGISNTGNNPLTVTIGSNVIEVDSAEGFEQSFKPFTTVMVTASGKFRAYGIFGDIPPVVNPPDTTPPVNVTLLTSVPGERNVQLSWVASTSQDTVAYEVYNGNVLVQSVTVTSLNIQGLLAATAYTFTVKAKDNAGNISSGVSVTATTLNASQPPDTTAPTSVTNLTGAPTETSVLLSWTASVSNDVAAYEVYRGSTLLAAVTTTTFSVTNLTAATGYTFMVKAKDASGNISTGTSVNVTTLSNTLPPDTTAPAEVTNLAAANHTETSLTLSWSASVSLDVASYDIYKDSVFLINVTGTTYNVTGLSADTQYSFSVRAKDLSGNVANGVSVTARTKATVIETGHVEDASLIYYANNPVNDSAITTPNKYFNGTEQFTLVLTAQVMGEYINLLSRQQEANSNSRVRLRIDGGYQLDTTFFGRNTSTSVDSYITIAKSTNTAISNDRFYHIVYVRDASHLSLYIDNVLKGQVACGSNINFDSSGVKGLTIGGKNGSNQTAVTKNAAYYNRALTAAERTRNFNALK
ncbi:hypothetical protein L3i20_v242750 [Paenibacillus sp. L3-i20]|nr:hypothetical protein L3i20_v242750 [Paenibacillus sp. L3-i20]